MRRSNNRRSRRTYCKNGQVLDLELLRHLAKWADKHMHAHTHTHTQHSTFLTSSLAVVHTVSSEMPINTPFRLGRACTQAGIYHYNICV